MKIEIELSEADSSRFRRDVSASGKSGSWRTGRLNDAKKETLFAEFHSLLSSGLDFNRAFELLIFGEGEGETGTLLTGLHAAVVGGCTLWEAFRGSGRFSALDCGVIRIGEETGKLNESLAFLCEYYRKKTAQRRMISGAVSYPLIILFTAVTVLVFMVTVIVPMFEQVYARMGGELPGITQAVIALSRNFKQYAFVFLLLGAGLGTAVFFGRHTERFRRLKSLLLLKFPLTGGLLRKHYQSHFCKLMYLLYGSGVPLLQGVEMLRDIITFYPYRRSFEAIGDGLRNGETFAENVGRFPELYGRKLPMLLRVGEETNRLSEVLFRQGDILTAELEHRLKQLGTVLEPLLILFVGILVAVVLISMYMPMFKLGNAIH